MSVLHIHHSRNTLKIPTQRRAFFDFKYKSKPISAKLNIKTHSAHEKTPQLKLDSNFDKSIPSLIKNKEQINKR